MISKKFPNKKGTVAFVVLVCLAVTTTIVLGAVSASLRQRRQLQQEMQLEQTRQLLDAGIGRAIAELEKDAAYTGETLDKIDAIDAIGNYKNAFIEIKKLDSLEQTEQTQFRIIAKLMRSRNMMQRSKTITLRKD